MWCKSFINTNLSVNVLKNLCTTATYVNKYLCFVREIERIYFFKHFSQYAYKHCKFILLHILYEIIKSSMYATRYKLVIVYNTVHLVRCVESMRIFKFRCDFRSNLIHIWDVCIFHRYDMQNKLKFTKKVIVLDASLIFYDQSTS